MKNLFLICIFLILGCSYENYNVTEYENLIKNAERSIVDGNLKMAHQNYISANSKIKEMFSVDVNNALVCALKLKEYKSASKWAKLLVRRGVPKEFFQNKMFDDFYISRYGETFIKKFQIYESEHLKNVNTELNIQLSNLFDADQSLYCEIPSGNVELNSAFNSTKILDSTLLEIFNMHGFPSENLIGVNYDYKKNEIVAVPKYSALYRHSFQSSSNLLSKELNSAIEEGKLKRSSYEYFTGQSNFDFVIVDCKIYYRTVYDSYEDSINLNFKKQRVIFNNSIEKNQNEYIIHEPIAMLDLDKGSSSSIMFTKIYSIIGKYKNCY